MKSKNEFIDCFSSIARTSNRYEVFKDFITMSCISIQNVFLKDEKLEDEYLSIVGRYGKDDVYKLANLLSCVANGLYEYCDFLGDVYMSLELGSKHVGQFFTPYTVSLAMAKLQIDKKIFEDINRHGFITMHEPASGSGGCVIAFCQVMLEQELNPQEELWVQCVDIDPVCAMMCYVQLSLLGIPAEIMIGDTLRMQFERKLYTPMHYLGKWSDRIAFMQKMKAMKSILDSFNMGLSQNEDLVIDAKEEFLLVP